MVDEPKGPETFSWICHSWLGRSTGSKAGDRTYCANAKCVPVDKDAPEIRQNLIPQLLRYKTGAIVASF